MEVTRRNFFFSFAGLCAGITMLPELLATPFQKKLILPGTFPDRGGFNIGVVLEDLGMGQLKIKTFGYRKHGSHSIMRTPERVVIVESFNPGVHEMLRPSKVGGGLAYISPDHTGKMKASPGIGVMDYYYDSANLMKKAESIPISREIIVPAPADALRRGFPRGKHEMPWITREYVKA